MSWADEPLALFDLESTGANPREARIVTGTLVLCQPGAEPDVHTWLADPGVDIPAEASTIHKITTEYAREHGRPATEVVEEIAAALTVAWEAGYPICGFNVGSYDLPLVAAEMKRHGFGGFTVGGPVIDPMVIDKRVDRYRRGSRKLADVAAHYDVPLNGAHDATEDALAAGRVAWRIAQRYPEIAAMSLEELHSNQVIWYAEQQHSFADYLRNRVAGQVEREAESLEDEHPEDAEQKRAEVADLRARADEIDATADQWPIRTGGAP